MKSRNIYSHLLVNSWEKIKMYIGDFEKENITCEKPLIVHLDNTLTFDYHISEICKTTGKKVNALARVSQYMNLSERKILISAFSDSQFRYCPLI